MNNHNFLSVMPALNPRLYFYPKSIFLKMNISGTKTESRCSQVKGENPSTIHERDWASVKVGAAQKRPKLGNRKKRYTKGRGEAIDHMPGDINR